MHWTDVAAVTVLAGAGCAVLYAGVQRALRRAVSEQQHSTDRQIAALATTVKALQAHVAELNRVAAERAGEMATTSASGESSNTKEPIKPEMLAVITAAATQFLGKTARISSVKPVSVNTGASAWTQQGRMTVQTSHNLRARN